MEPGCKFSCALLLRLKSTFLRICWAAPTTQPGLLWSNYFSKLSHIRAAHSNNARQKNCRLKLSLLSTSTNIRGLKQWVIMKGDWWKGPLICKGLGASHIWTQEAEREGKRSGRHVRMCVRVFGGTLGSAAVLTNPSKTSTHFLWQFCRCWADLAPLSLFSVCVLFTIQASNGFIKLPKERKCCPCSDFPLPVIKLYGLSLKQKVAYICSLNLWTRRHSKHQPEFIAGSLLAQGRGN